MEKATPIVTVSGSRYECGYQHGEQATEEIRHNIDYYYGWWRRNLRMNKQDIYDRIDSVIFTCEEYDAGLVEEMRARRGNSSRTELGLSGRCGKLLYRVTGSGG